MKQYILLLITIFYSLTVLAGEYTDSTNIKTDDSLHFTRNFSRKIDKVSSSRFYQMTYIGVPLTVGGIIVKSEDDHFRNNEAVINWRKENYNENSSMYQTGSGYNGSKT